MTEPPYASRLSALLLSCFMAIPCAAQADDPGWFAPHIADTGVSLAVLQSVDKAAEINPLGFPGVVVAKLAVEGIALSLRDAGDIESCLALASGARWGGWIGTGATLGGLVGGPVGLAFGGLVAGIWSREWSARSASTTCTALPALIDPEPYSYSGPECIGWGDARPDFCNIY